MKQFFKRLYLNKPASGFQNFIPGIVIFVLFTSVLFGCKKQDILPENNSPSKDITSTSFLRHSNPLGPSVERVLNDIKNKMNERQVNDFIKKAGFINWDKSVAYASPGGRNTASRRQNEADSIVVLPVVLPEADNVNAALVAKIYNNGDSVVYSTHFKNHFSAIDSTDLPEQNITARELYVLGMAQLDAEVFNHKKFIISDHNLNFNQQVNARVGGSGIASVSITVGECEYNFTYSSSVVFPPVTIYTYSAPCGAPLLLPPAAFLNDLDESYGFVYYSSTPAGEGGGGGPVSPYQLEFSNFYNALNTNQQDFLDNQEYNEYYNGFADYLILHQYSQASKDHIVWCINYLTSPATLITTFSEFASFYLNDFPSLSFLSQDDINWLNNYPYLQSRIYYYLQNTIALNMEEKIQFHIDKLRTDQEYFVFNSAYSTYTQYKNVWFNDQAFLFNLGGGTFGEWAINYLIQHPTESFNTLYYSHLTEVENNLLEPCLKGVINSITKDKHKSLVFDLFKKEQAIAKPNFPLKFTYEEVTSLPYNAPAATQDAYSYSSPTTISGGIMIIKLNTTALAGKSKEYIASVVLHEICHAIKKAIAVNESFPNPPLILSQEEEHIKMIEKKYPLEIYNNLILLYPNANTTEMKDLAIGGFADVLFSNGTLLNNALTQQITGADYFPSIDISNAYNNTIPDYKDLIKGTICN